jgi:DNA/RNA non-specific endonuclease
MSGPFSNVHLFTLFFIFYFIEYYTFIQIILFFSCTDNDNESQCQVDMNRNSGEQQQQQYRPQPLLIYPNTSKFFRPTERTGVIKVKQNEKVELFCSTGFASPTTSITDQSVLIRCNRNGQFQLDNDDSTHSYFACRKHPTHSARRHSNTRCFNNATSVDIGFEINERFPTVMTLCHDPITEQTYYVYYKLTPANVTPQRNVKRPSFIQASFFPGKDVEELYKRENQRKVLEEFFEHAMDKKESDLYLSRGINTLICFFFVFFNQGI